MHFKIKQEIKGNIKHFQKKEMSNSIDESEVGSPKSQNGVPDLMTNNVIQESSDLGNQASTISI